MINKNIRKYKLFCVEQAVSIDKLKKYNSFLSNDNFSENLKELNTLIIKLKDDIQKLNYFEITIQNDKMELLDVTCTFSLFSQNIISKISNFLFDNEQNSDKYLEVVFPEGYKRNLFPRIEIERNYFNRIHIGEIPLIIRGIGVGTKCYKTMIRKLGYISSIGQDRTKDAELIWKSIIKDTGIYSFIYGNKIISFSNKLDSEKIINILRKFFKDELENNSNEIIIDDDFIKKYNIDKL